MTPQANQSLIEATILLALALGFVALLRWRTGMWPWEWRERDKGEVVRTPEEIEAEIIALNRDLLAMLGPEEFAEFQRRLAEADYPPGAASRSF